MVQLQNSFRRLPDFAAIFACIFALILVSARFFYQLPATLDSVVALDPVIPSAPAIEGTGFLQNAVFPSTPSPGFDMTAKRFGSYLGGDASIGQVVTRWYKSNGAFDILVAGYPDGRLTKLVLEGAVQGGSTERMLVMPKFSPGEKWEELRITPPASWTRFRIAATDQAPGFRGWLGFSEPVTISKSSTALLVHLSFLLLSAVTAFMLTLGPGLVIRLVKKRNGSPMPGFYWLPVPGFLTAVAIGLLAWKGPKVLMPSGAATLGVGLVAVVCLLVFLRGDIATVFSKFELRAVAVVILLSVIAISKATYSVGPKDELYGRTISRSLEIGDRSDSRINYHLVQMFALRGHAFGTLATSLLAPWNFSHRGPLAGLATTPIVLSNPVRLMAEKPDQSWQPFDPQGFAAYRVAFIVMSCCFLLPVYGLMRLFLDEPALLALLVVVGSPFVVHELYFTWPKIIAAGFVFVSASLAWERKYLYSGLLLGLAYLSHPSALLSVPVVLAFPVLQIQTFRRPLMMGWLKQVLGLAVFLTFWRVINGRHYSQSGFINYVRMAENLPPTFSNWIAVRYLSLLNTLVPLHLFFFNPQNSAIQFIGAAPPVVTFFFQDWTSLPSGVGLLLFVALMFWLALGFHFARWAFLLLVVLPFAIFLLYWGSATTGLLREGLHVWVIGTLCFATWSWQKFGASSNRWWRFASFALLLRAVETMAMLVVPGIVTTGTVLGENFFASDCLTLTLIVGGCLVLYTYTFKFSESLRVVANGQ